MESVKPALALALLAFTACDTSKNTTVPAPTVLLGATVLDGTGASPRPHQAVLLEGQEIARITDADDFVTPKGARVIDISGKWLVPGFVDLHVHLPADATVQDAILERLLEHGVTTILNPGSRPGAGPLLRERLQRTGMLAPRFHTAGRLIDDSPDGRKVGGWAAQTPTESALRAEIQAQAREDVDFVKLYAGLSPALVSAAIDESHELGIPLIGHLEATYWGDAARMGIDMLVHSGWATPMDEIIELQDPEHATDTEWYLAYRAAPSNQKFAALVETLVEEAVVVVPTIAIQQASALGRDLELLARLRPELAPEADLPGWWGAGWRRQHPYYDFATEEEAELAAEVYVPALLEILEAFYRDGVTLAVGTDVGNAWMTPGVSFHHELELYQESGIPPLAILGMATRNGAEALGLASSVGTIEVGKQADLVVLGGDPTMDIRNTQEIERVFLGGREVQLAVDLPLETGKAP